MSRFLNRWRGGKIGTGENKFTFHLWKFLPCVLIVGSSRHHHMTIIPFAELTISRQKAFLAISAMRRRADEAMQEAQADHGTQSPQFAEAATRYEQATAMLSILFMSQQNQPAVYYEAIK